MSSCNDSKSYADLLRDETKAINNYLADQRVVGDVPADSVFESRRSIAEKIYKESGATAATGEEHEEAIGKIMSDLAKDPAKDAPYYRMDEDGNVYMKVIREGDMENRPKYNDLVYFRFLRYNLAGYDNGVYPTPEVQRLKHGQQRRVDTLRQLSVSSVIDMGRRSAAAALLPRLRM